MVMELNNTEYAFACRIDNVKQAAIGNYMISGGAVTEQGPTAMAVDYAAMVIRVNGKYKSIGSGSKSVDAAHASLDRYDIISAQDDGTVDYTAGTAAANPYPPDLPADSTLLVVIFVENQATVIENADIQDNRLITQETGTVPISTAVPWAKTLSGTPSIKDGWVQCDGQTLSDGDSPIDGEDIPDMNGQNYFARGNSTSGGTGGAATHTLIEAEMPAHTHTVDTKSPGFTGGNSDAVGATTSDGTMTSGSTGGGGAHNNEPQYYDFVYAMRTR